MVLLNGSIQTSYVTVEPKRRKQDADSADTAAVDEASSAVDAPSAEFGQDRPSSGRELRRARIVITVQRTESYRQWLIDNPLQSAGTGDEEEIDLDEVVTSSAEQEP